MTLDEAIKHCKEVVDEELCEVQECLAVYDMEEATKCGKCAEEHRQLAEWLKELKQLKEQWQDLKETIIEARDGDGTVTQQEICKFLVNYMDVLEKNVSGSGKFEQGLDNADQDTLMPAT